VVDNLGASVESASVSIDLTDGTTIWKGTASTGADGTVTFRLRNAPDGCYSTDVTNVVANGLTWDGVAAQGPGQCKPPSNGNGNGKGSGGSLQAVE